MLKHIHSDLNHLKFVLALFKTNIKKQHLNMVNFFLKLLTQFSHLYDSIDFNHTNERKFETSKHLQPHANDNWPCIKNNDSQPVF